MTDTYLHSFAAMGTVVTIRLVDAGRTPTERTERVAAVARAAEWFHDVERTCSRFDEHSELRQLSSRIGVAVPVSATLYEAVRFALAVAAESGGVFDPTVGARMERRGFNRDYRSGRAVTTPLIPTDGATYRDVQLDDDQRTIILLRPLLLDLGAVAKGMAIDLAARELQSFTDFVIDAGGDLYFGGSNDAGQPWSAGIRHPRESSVIEALRVSDAAVCTSGDYERRTAAGHHLIDARQEEPVDDVASVTVVAPSAMAADALATAAFVLGPAVGLAFLERQGVEGLIITPALERFATRGLPVKDVSHGASDVAQSH